MRRMLLPVALAAVTLALPAVADAHRPSRQATDNQARQAGKDRAHANTLVFAVQHGTRVVRRSLWGRHGRCARVRVPVVFASPGDYPASSGAVFYRTCWRLRPWKIATIYQGAVLDGARTAKGRSR